MKKHLIDSFNDLADNLGALAEQIVAIETLPPRGEWARGAVEEDVDNLIKTIRSKLDRVHSLLKNKIWE